MDIGLVSCSKSKRETPSSPAELYMPSALFRKARAYCEANHDAWYILSAKHGLLEPDGPPIEPYDETLTGARVARRRTWSRRVFEELRDVGVLRNEVTLVFHAGKAYYGELLPMLQATGVGVRIPTEGLAIGETMAWYNKH